ncbi:enoyl-CoA hydratase/isomerase family protein [Pseudonocardia lacus]|jgi:enoyl-CoA hydratase/carnithine racemase|uniref:enoyl-CoA hydratase/isomerase family protein n=1 Tax=Pseudonocardia lacus TaxID=2835865 RepID=UPI001BDCD2C1|nr:enoyl-CoA hydratase/isomerase family protein [Pseudonocardia lacus]
MGFTSSDSTYSDIRIEEPEPGITVLTLTRPERMNAVRFETHDQIADAVGSLRTRALVITGEGRGFCAGDDVVDIFNNGEGDGVDMGADPALDSTSRLLLSRDYPIIAAVNGPAVGYGMGLALMADLRVAARTAKFAELYIRRGQAADATGFGRLWQLIGRERATWMLLTGEMITAEQAAEWGLVLEVVPEGQALERALQVARTVAGQPPLVVEASKQAMRRVSDPDWERFGDWLGPVHARLFRTEDHREAVRAYLERRDPAYQGR